MWGRKTVALILPTEENQNFLLETISEFDATGYIDEIIVVGGDMGDKKEEKLRENRAKFIRINKFMQGTALRAGIKNTKADLLVIAEATGAFVGKDVLKLLAYSDDFDMVFGSRTHLPLIEKKSTMTFPRRIINVIFGKLISLLFMTYPLTDVACTLRLTNKKGWRKVSKDCKSEGEMFIVEWLINAAKNKVRFMEIPINFKTPPGKSVYSESYLPLTRKGLIIFFYIWKIWLIQIISKR